MFKKPIILAMTIATALVMSGCCEEEDPKTKKMVADITDDAMKTVMPQMVKTLTGKVKENGYAEAVTFCKDFVPEFGKNQHQVLQQKYGEEYNVSDFKFRRVTLKPRNPANKPDATEEKILKTWQTEEEKGKPIDTTVKKAGEKWYGLAPIRIISNTCLGCHGTAEAADAEAMKKIKELYPQDAATGYELNQLRGAFSVTLTAPEN